MKIKAKNLLISSLIGFISSFIAIGSTFGWLVSGWISQGSVINFTAGNTKAPDFIMWTYLSKEDIAAGATGTEGWVTGATLSDSENISSNILINSVECSTIKEDGNTKYAYTLSSLQLGSMDNLVSIKDDNIIYMRFFINPEKQGHKIKLSTGFHKGTTDSLNSYITAYGKDGLSINDIGHPTNNPTTTVQQALINLCESENKSLLEFDYATSLVAYTPNDFSTLSFEKMAAGDVLVDETNTIACLCEYTKESDSSYYLYLKIQPNLYAFRDVAGLINKYMPCTILFDVEIDLVSYMEDTSAPISELPIAESSDGGD